MSANSFGSLFKIISFGESHGPALGVVIEGCPAGVRYDEALLVHELERRRPGQSAHVSTRQEADAPKVLSGIFEGQTLGTPICALVYNEDARSQDYAAIQASPRAGHADDVWKEKFGRSDYRGGGRSSGRETLARVMGGAFAQMFLQQTSPQMKVSSYPKSIGNLDFSPADIDTNSKWGLKPQAEIEVEKYLTALKTEGNSVGGIIEVRVHNPIKSLGQPVFHKLKAELSSAYMSIGATTGVELGGGFALARQTGIETHQSAATDTVAASVYGGIRGGISTGEEITLRVAFKATSSILDVAKRGRHDPCIVLRARPVVEAMTYLVLADQVLWSRLDKI